MLEEEGKCFAEPAVVHRSRPYVEQCSCCSNSLHLLGHLVARTVFEDTC